MKTEQNQTADAGVFMSAASFGRRTGALLYDLLILIAVWMLATIPFVVLIGEPSQGVGVRIALQCYLLAVACVYFTGFWTRGGQTLGLLAWKCRLTTVDGAPVGLKRALLRYLAGLLSISSLGLGFVWAAVDRDRLAWHDRLSGTRLMHLRPGGRQYMESR